jgi:glucose/arabinose dehydrogenase
MGSRFQNSPVGVVVAVLAVVATACTGPVARPSAAPSGTSTVPASATGSGSPSASGSRSPGQRTLASGLDVPWDLAVLPDGTALVTLRDAAQVVRVVPGAAPQVVARIDDVRAEGEGGLLGIALSPQFRSDHLVYLYLTAAQDNRVLRYRYVDGSLRDPALVFSGIPKASNHNGGRLRFGPDGLLYLGTGDAGSGEASQDRDSLAGKILRIAPDGSVPPGNPFGSAVYSLGHRNVQGLGWDARGRLFASEFGQNTLDELNRIEPGGNYGWPGSEGPDDDSGTVDPLLTWATSEASPSGIAVEPDGTVFLAALRGERLWRAEPAGDGMAEPAVALSGFGRLRAVEIVGDEAWILTNNTARGTPRPGDDRLVAVPLAELGG